MHLLARGDEVFSVSFNYGQKHILELQRLQNQFDYLEDEGYRVPNVMLDLSSVMQSFSSALTEEDQVVPEGFYEEANMKATVVPNRNAIFSSILYGYALSISMDEKVDVEIALGVHSGDHAIYPDCRPEFYEAIGNAFAIGNWGSERIKYYLPYMQSNKFGILQDAEQSIAALGLDFDTVFANTNTSYAPDSAGRASGKTGADIERILAFHEFGRPDPVEYVKSWEEVLDDALEVQREFVASGAAS